MIRLSNLHKQCDRKRTFYFHTIEDCNEFIETLNENSCNVNWGEPREIPDTAKIRNDERLLMDKSPKERAENALNWALEMTNDPFSIFIP